MLYVYIIAPSAPAVVFVTSNVTDTIVVEWKSPKFVIHRVDRYYIEYQAANEPDSHEMVIEEVNNLYGFQQVNSISVVLTCDADVLYIVER